MSREKRFPSDANKSRSRPAPIQVKAPDPVVGEKQELIQVIYERENHHLLNNVFALVRGLNNVPVSVWDKVKDHPEVKHMLTVGDLKYPSGKKQKNNE